MSALAQAQHIIVQQIILFVLARLAHVPAQAVVQCLIVLHVLILMVGVVTQLATVMFAGMKSHYIIMNIVLILAIIMLRQIITAVQGLVFVPLAHIPPHPMEKTMIVMDSRTKRLALHRAVGVLISAPPHAEHGAIRAAPTAVATRLAWTTCHLARIVT